MAQPAEFEEKEYEHPLNVELLSDNRNPLWTPGQVFEEHFGIDAALHATHPRFWRLFGYTHIPHGVILDHFRWGQIWRHTGHRRQLPTFRTNLLLQTKRPHHRIVNNTAYALHGIAGQYWQFEKTEHQQKALEYLHNRLSNRALICYACAAFHSLTDLYSHTTNQSLVDNSTFVQVHRMTNHHKWVYNQAGTVGIGCSEIEKIEDKNFRDQIKSLSNLNKGENTPLQNLLDLEKSAIGITEELGQKNPVANEFYRRQQIIAKEIGYNLSDAKEIQALRAYLTFATFCDLTNSTWLTIGHE